LHLEDLTFLSLLSSLLRGQEYSRGGKKKVFRSKEEAVEERLLISSYFLATAGQLMLSVLKRYVESQGENSFN